MDSSQNISDYFGKLGRLIGTFDFTRHGQNESMGKDAAGIAAEGILDRSVADQAGADGVFPENDPEKYTPWKRRKYGVDLIGFRTGQMISLPSLLGKVEVSPDSVLIHYGTGLAPAESMSSNYISESDKRVTDTEKAEYFTEKKGRWFALDDKIAGQVREFFADQLGTFIKELNAR